MQLNNPTVAAESALGQLALADGDVVLLDVTFELTDTHRGHTIFQAAHARGASYVHLDRDLCAPQSGQNGRHPLPDRQAFLKTLGELGVQPDSDVFVLDQGNAMFAARLWWMLRWVGHERVRVLDGGMAAWVAASGPVESGPGRPRQAGALPYPERPSGVRTVEADALQAALGKGQKIVDARAPERYRGDVEPLDAVAGHIPGALNLPFAGNLGPDGRFLPAGALRERWAKVLGDRPQDVVHQCGSGVTACHNLLATELAGFPLGVLYAGSWSEWCSDPARPVARGDDTCAAAT